MQLQLQRVAARFRYKKKTLFILTYHYSSTFHYWSSSQNTLPKKSYSVPFQSNTPASVDVMCSGSEDHLFRTKGPGSVLCHCCIDMPLCILYFAFVYVAICLHWSSIPCTYASFWSCYFCIVCFLVVLSKSRQIKESNHGCFLFFLAIRSKGRQKGKVASFS